MFAILLILLPGVVLGQYDELLFGKRGSGRGAEVGSYVLENIESGRLIGCKYTDICPVERRCYDDRLFGTCVAKLDDANFVYDLAPELERVLEFAMRDLFKEHFRWSNFYTQCFLQSVIRSSELQQYLDVRHCKKKEDSADHGSSSRSTELGSSKESRQEHINPLSNSDTAISRTAAGYVDPKLVRKELNIAKRKRSEWIWLRFDRNISVYEKTAVMATINRALNFPKEIDQFQLSPDGVSLYFRLPLDAAFMAENVTKYFKSNLNIVPNLHIVDVGAGYRTSSSSAAAAEDQTDIQAMPIGGGSNGGSFTAVVAVCGSVLAVLFLVLAGFCIQRLRHRRDKLGEVISGGAGDSTTGGQHYADLFRGSTKAQPGARQHGGVASRPVASSPVSTRSSTSSWTDEAAQAPSNMDVYTGHLILSYMEKHLRDRQRLQAEWATVSAYEPEDSRTLVGAANPAYNRYPDRLPYDKNRVTLRGSDTDKYINASFIVDHDPKVPVYVATQAPPAVAVNEFWDMIWQNGVVVIVSLTENEEVEPFWPLEGLQLYHNYEVNLVSEHVWSDEYLVRNFYLKSVAPRATAAAAPPETRTVTQFHYLKWTPGKTPVNARSILEFRRKVNKSYRSKSTPILVQCSDGCGRSGTYMLLDLILNRIGRGMKEMDIAATLEHLRDQRMHLVSNEEQFGFVLTTISEEVNTILKVLNN